MRKIKATVLLFLSLMFYWAAAAFAGPASEIDIPYKKFTLDNGLTVIIHEDHKAPIVAVNIWYHVGSKNEKTGKTGFAHLFEHLMFNGSENYDDDYFQAMERIGATDLNGTTNPDRTNFFENVPKNAFEVALWMESDRMGHLLPAITQEKLDEQRGVVQNEKRQNENQPYGGVRQIITENTYPKGHPYSWTTIGSMKDLDSASLDDVHEWFKNYYGAANAVIVVAGDVKTDEALEKVKKYFGDVPPGPPVTAQKVWVAKMRGEHRAFIEDRVPQARLYMIWNVPEWGNKELDHLDLFSDILSSGKTSRLYKRLVYDDQIATSVSAYYAPREIGSQFYIVADIKPGVETAAVEKAIKEELTKALREGPTEDELKRVKTQFFARFIRGIERIGGFGGKSDILAMNMVYGGSPDYYKVKLKNIEEAASADIRKSARKWLSDGVFILEVQPFPNFKAAKADFDRSKMPVPGTPPDVKFPAFQRTKLDNGLNIVLATRKAVPVVNMRLIIDAGYAADQFAKPGTAKMTMNMLDEGTKNRTWLEISEELDALGAELGSGSDLDASVVSLNALKDKLDPSLDIFADVILNPVFPEKDFNRLKKQLLAGIEREKVRPISMALRVFPELLYGKDHAYGNPLTGSGTTESVQSITVEDLKKFHDTWFKPNNATLVVVGDITMDEIKDKLDDLFGDWEEGKIPVKNIGLVTQKEKSQVYILDRPGSMQSIIFAGHVVLPKANPDEEAIQMMNKILGGEFTSRVNMNLREDKHYAYGAFTFIWSAKGQRPFIAYAPVQTDKTMESMMEIKKEIEGIIGKKPPTEEEFAKTKKNEILSLPGSWETNGAVVGSLSEIVEYGLPDDYYANYAKTIQNLKLEQIRKAAKEILHPDKLVWVIVGDRSKIEEPIRKAGFKNINFIDADGNVVK
jgi:zinc protease